ncbi:recQ-mediated genome instability protein 1 isoform X2 [Gastrolobium bilobum]|uniref:recQ-mediated genome instability protein 1 isoform X2 n=1 Tax=Gastrolobium bilobum TaxID=150636 RepID=UPI002AB01351|nr:recQ-mediated genome instability protein 1 isoform X2 [Gastrolobium bilobum]
MPIRRLRLDDDEEEEEEEDQDNEIQDALQPQPQPHTVTVTVTHQPPNPTNFPSEPVEISDDEEFIDVSDNLSPPPVPGCPISDYLCRLGLCLKRDWLASCLRELQGSTRGFEGFDVTTKAKLCFEQFLFADMNFCGSGVLPPNVDSMHLRVLPGPYVLQVDEIINISCPLRGRYQQAPPGLKRCLKLSMTDGIQRVFGMEYRPIKALEVCASAGLKVAITNVHVRRGLLMLVPETIEVLGGLVDQLDAARKRLVDELNKPPRGKRTKNGVLPPLATRATLAAWPSNGVNDLGRSASTLHNTDFVQANNQGAGLSMTGTGNRLTTEDTLLMGAQNAASNSTPPMVSNAEAMNMDMHRDTNPVSFTNSITNQYSSIIAKAEEMHIHIANITRENSVGNQSSHMLSNVAVAHKDTVHVTRESSMATNCSPVAENVETDSGRIHVITDNALSRGSSSTVSNSDDIQMVDASDHPLILSGNQEVPFTYLASLSTKWAEMKEKVPLVQGKIKYKKRTTYELQAYVDDGSLISEILIDHDVVQKGIGYSPQEVTAALSSSDMRIVHNMKETMRKFQAFLANFEGIILVELNKKSSLPLALEMCQGCPQTDAWLLLRRLKSLQPAQVE